MSKKTTISITIDHETVRQIRLLNINISGEVNNFLNSLINQKTKDLSGININLEKIKRDNLNKKLIAIQAELSTSNDLIAEYEEKKTKAEIEKLQQEKEKMEAAKKCINCGNNLDDQLKKA